MLKRLALVAMLGSAHAAFAQKLPTDDSLVTVSAVGSVTAPNDEAQLVFGYEEQGKDKALLASNVNQRLKQGIGVLKKACPNAQLTLESYRTIAVYEERNTALANKREPQQTGWRVSQQVRLVTSDLAALPAVVAAAQKVLALSEVHFGLSEEATGKMEQRRVEAAYQSLEQRVAFIAGAMRRQAGDYKLESLDFTQPNIERVVVTGSRLRRQDLTEVEEPSLLPGETRLQLQVTAKVRFK